MRLGIRGIRVLEVIGVGNNAPSDFFRISKSYLGRVEDGDFTIRERSGSALSPKFGYCQDPPGTNYVGRGG